MVAGGGTSRMERVEEGGRSTKRTIKKPTHFNPRHVRGTEQQITKADNKDAVQWQQTREILSVMDETDHSSPTKGRRKAEAEVKKEAEGVEIEEIVVDEDEDENDGDGADAMLPKVTRSGAARADDHQALPKSRATPARSAPHSKRRQTEAGRASSQPSAVPPAKAVTDGGSSGDGASSPRKISRKSPAKAENATPETSVKRAFPASPVSGACSSATSPEVGESTAKRSTSKRRQPGRERGGGDERTHKPSEEGGDDAKDGHAPSTPDGSTIQDSHPSSAESDRLRTSSRTRARGTRRGGKCPAQTSLQFDGYETPNATPQKLGAAIVRPKARKASLADTLGREEDDDREVGEGVGEEEEEEEVVAETPSTSQTGGVAAVGAVGGGKRGRDKDVMVAEGSGGKQVKAGSRASPRGKPKSTSAKEGVVARSGGPDAAREEGSSKGGGREDGESVKVAQGEGKGKVEVEECGHEHENADAKVSPKDVDKAEGIVGGGGDSGSSSSSVRARASSSVGDGAAAGEGGQRGGRGGEEGEAMVQNWSNEAKRARVGWSTDADFCDADTLMRDSEVGSSVGKPTCPRMVTDDGVVHTLAFGNEVYNWTAGTIDLPPGTRTTMTGKGQYHTLFVMSGSVTCKFVEMEGFEGVLNDGGERKFPIMGEIRDGGCFRVNL
jgi:hypothetical protein